MNARLTVPLVAALALVSVAISARAPAPATPTWAPAGALTASSTDVPVPTRSRWVPPRDREFLGGDTWGWGITVYADETRVQTVGLAVAPRKDGKGTLTVLEEHGVGRRGPSVRTAHEVELPFRPHHVTSAGLDRFALVGRDVEERVVLETWALVDDPEGDLADAPTDAGALAAALDEELTAEDARSLLAAAVPRSFRRTPLSAGTLGESVSCLQYGSGGRFLLFVTKDGERATLHQLPLDPVLETAVVTTSDEHPELDRMVGVDAFWQEGLGVFYEFHPRLEELGSVGLVLVDADDDGRIDDILTGTEDELRTQGVGGYGECHPLFLRPLPTAGR